MGKKVIIETEDCVGCESCVELCADVFGVDEGAQKAVVILAFGVLILEDTSSTRPNRRLRIS